LELDRFGNRESNQIYFVITSQAMRSPELPAGSRDIVIGGYVPNDDASSQDHRRQNRSLQARETGLLSLFGVESA
jgi:hypothetical protein